MKKGFTLIEIAITLVVVGLLVVGVSQAIEIIKSFKVKNIYSEAEELNKLYYAFELQYDCKPGDCATINDYFNGVTLNGNGDNEITPFEDNGDIIYESLLMFEHLGYAELYSYFSKNNSCYFNPDTSDVIELFRGCNYKLLDFNTTIFAYAYSEFSADVRPYGLFACINTTSGCLTGNVGNTFDIDRILEFDAKFDDGIPLEGNILSACTTEINSFLDFETADRSLVYDLTKETCPIIVKFN